MPTNLSLPVEIWQTILRYGIGIQDFLDPEAFEGALSDFQLSDKHYERNNEEAYWLAERDRNSFQRVCRSWEEYLRPFEHRYVRMLDIWHETIPLLALKNAIRVSFARYNCKCARLCRPELYKRRGIQATLRDRSMFFGEICGELVEKSGPLNGLLIVDMKGETIWNKGLLQLASNAPQIKVFLGRDQENGGGCYRPTEIICKLAELRYFYGHGCWELLDSTMVVSKLVTVSFINLAFPAPDGAMPKWKIPSLRHLRIDNTWYHEGHSFLDYAVYPLLRNVGGHLQSLYLSGPEVEHELPPEIWDLCPKLEKLSTTMRLVSPPPTSHPFNTYVATRRNVSKGETAFLHWLNLQRIVVDWIWDAAHRGQAISQKWRRACAARNIRIEDQHGITWEEYLERNSQQPRAPFLNLVAPSWL